MGLEANISPEAIGKSIISPEGKDGKDILEAIKNRVLGIETSGQALVDQAERLNLNSPQIKEVVADVGLANQQVNIEAQESLKAIEDIKPQEAIPPLPQPKQEAKIARQAEQKIQREQLADQNLTTPDLLKVQARLRFGEKQSLLLDKETVKQELGPLCDALRDKIVLGHLLNPDDTKREHDEAAITEMVGLLKSYGYANQESDQDVAKYCRSAYGAMKASIAKEASLAKSDKPWWKNLRTYNSLLLAACKGSVYFTLGGLTTAFLTPIAGAATVGGLRVLDTYLTNKLIKEKDIKRYKKELAQQETKEGQDGLQQPSGAEATMDSLLTLMIGQKRASLEPRVESERDVNYYKDRYINTMKAMGPEVADLSEEKLEKSAQALAVFEALDDKLDQRQQQEVQRREAQQPGLWGRFQQAVNKARNSEFLRIINADGLDEMSRAVTATTASVGIGLALRQGALRVPGLKIALGAWAGYRTGKLVEKLALGKGTPEMIVNQNLASLNNLSATDNYDEYLKTLGETKAVLSSIKPTSQNRLNLENWQKGLNQATMDLALATVEAKADQDLENKLEGLDQGLTQSQKAGQEGQKKARVFKVLKQVGIRGGMTAAGAVLGSGIFNDEIAKVLGYLEKKSSQYAGDIKEAVAKIDLSSQAGAAELPAGATPPSVSSPNLEPQNLSTQSPETRNIEISKPPHVETSIIAKAVDTKPPAAGSIASVAEQQKVGPSKIVETPQELAQQTPKKVAEQPLKEVARQLHAEYRGGHSVWQEADKQLGARFGDQFSQLGNGDSKAHKLLEIYNTDRMKDTIVANPDKYGLPANINFNQMSAEQIKGLDWDKAFHDTFASKGLSTSLSGEHLAGLGEATTKATITEPASLAKEIPNQEPPIKPIQLGQETVTPENALPAVQPHVESPQPDGVTTADIVKPGQVVQPEVLPVYAETIDAPTNPLQPPRPYQEQHPLETPPSPNLETSTSPPIETPNLETPTSPNEALKSLPAEVQKIAEMGRANSDGALDQWLEEKPKNADEAFCHVETNEGNLTLFKNPKTGDLFYNTDPKGAPKNYDYIFHKVGNEQSYVIGPSTKENPLQVAELAIKKEAPMYKTNQLIYVDQNTGRIFDVSGSPLQGKKLIAGVANQFQEFKETLLPNGRYQYTLQDSQLSGQAPKVFGYVSSQRGIQEVLSTADVAADLANPKSELSLAIEANKAFVDKIVDDQLSDEEIQTFMQESGNGHLEMLKQALASGKITDEATKKIIKTQTDLLETLQQATSNPPR